MVLPKLSHDERLPIYQRLADVLRDEIVEGRLRPGDRAPSEPELAAEYDLAPGTVRSALGQLVEEGLLERVRGRGTFVRQPNFDRSLFRFYRFRGTSGEWTVPESRILRREKEAVPQAIAHRLSIKDSAAGISMSRLRLIDEKPVMLEEIWVPFKGFQEFLNVPISDIGPLLYPVYDAVCGQLVASAEEELTAEAASAVTARALKIKTGAPVIVIDRLARAFDGTPIEWRRSRGRADEFHYRTEIR